MNGDADRALLLARRVPRETVVPGRAYLIHARNGGAGIAVLEGERLGYRLRREKFGDVFLFVEWDWDEGPPHGTAIPLRALPDEPPREERMLLAWLSDREAEYQFEIENAWHEAIWGRPRQDS